MAATDTASLLEGLLPEQRDIVETLDRPVFVAAGAGSGKTFTLTRRIVWALCPGSGEGGRPFLDSLDQALVITFTEKAAGEIKERVRGALRQAGLAEEALKVDSAWVSTIHHMCSRILRAHALDLGLDPAFSMVGEQQAEVLRAQATERALAELEGDPGLDALFAEYGAEAGRSGRDGVVGLVRSVLDKAASAELGLDSLGFVPARVGVADVMRSVTDAYEALCGCDNKSEDELAACREALGSLRGFWDLAPDARDGLAASVVLEGLYRPNGNKWRAKAVSAFCKEAQTQLAAARAEVALARAQELEEPLMHLARRIEQNYAAAKRELGVLDNDDLLQLVARAFREHPEIARTYASKFRLVMVDEFQDTNGQQVSMVKGLSGEGACHLTTVGDAQQAIYGFRGADVGVFEDRGREVGEAGTVRLDYNFRSNDAILRFVARVCGDTGIVPSFMDLKAKQRTNQSFPEGKHPRVVVELTRAHKHKNSSAPAELRTELAAAQLADRLARIRDVGVEARDMAVLMRSLNQADVYIRALRERGIESVVVGGSTFSQAPEVGAVLALLRTLANPRDTKSGLFPVLESGMFSLDANDMLVLATKPQELLDAPAKRRIYPGARADVPDFAGVVVSERLSAARRVLTRAWGRVGKLPVADVCLMAIRESGWLGRLEDEGVSGRAVAANILAAVRHIRELAEPEGLDAIRAADEFARWLDAAKEGPAALSGEGLDAVSLMTAHASKGLEFKVVAVVGCCGAERAHAAPRLLSRRVGDRVLMSLAPKTLPAADLGEDAPATAEECVSPLEWRSLMEADYSEGQAREDGRLLYVALTRARECVILALGATELSKGGVSPAMTQQVLSGVFVERPVAGEGSFDYGGAEAGLVRVVDVTLGADGSVSVDAGGTLPACEATRACGAAGEGIDAGADGGSDDGAGLAYGASAELAVVAADASSATPVPPDAFAVPEPPLDSSTQAELSFWRPREGVFSYSSARASVAASVAGSSSFGGMLDLPVPCEEAGGASYGSGVLSPEPQAAARRRSSAASASEPVDDAASEGLADADRATSLGSAFHELARFIVETGHAPSPERIGTVAAAYGVGRAGRARLEAALARWEGSAIRREVLGYALVRAEVPFFCEVDSALGRNLEGAIDLLATDDLPQASGSPRIAEGAAQDAARQAVGGVGHVRPRALLVDYKTGDHGLTFAQIRARHELQARFYASVLRGQGYGDVDCVFVCVELADASGEPVCVRYRFR